MPTTCSQTGQTQPPVRMPTHLQLSRSDSTVSQNADPPAAQQVSPERPVAVDYDMQIELVKFLSTPVPSPTHRRTTVQPSPYHCYTSTMLRPFIHQTAAFSPSCHGPSKFGFFHHATALPPPCRRHSSIMPRSMRHAMVLPLPCHGPSSAMPLRGANLPSLRTRRAAAVTLSSCFATYLPAAVLYADVIVA